MTGEGRGTRGVRAEGEASPCCSHVPLNAIGEAILVSDGRGRITFVSSAAQLLVGAAAADILGHPVDAVLRFSELSQAPTLSPGVAASGVCAAVLSTISGIRRYVEYTCSTLEDSDAHVYVIRDVTQRRKLSEQEVLLDRLNSLSSLVAGVAHELNNPLAFSLGSLELARRTLTSLRESGAATSKDALLDRLEKSIETAVHGATRVAEIVNDLRTFARTSQESTTLVDVQECLDGAIRLSMHETRQRARIVRETHAHPMVYASERRLSQLFVNLLIYAAQSMTPAGEDNTIRITIDANDDSEAVIEISDNGGRIAPALLPHVFNPLFSPRPVAQGSGLGLSVCHDIVAELGGTISAHSDAYGASFRVVLKGRKSAVEAAQPTVEPSHEERRAKRLLLVDDEPALVSVFSELLTDEGYEVSCASNGSEALALLRTSPRFDVVLCDVMMPVMGGIDLFERTAEFSSEQCSRFIFMTGGATTDRAAKFLGTTQQPWISKPIEMRRLLEALDRLTQARAAPTEAQPSAVRKIATSLEPR